MYNTIILCVYCYSKTTEDVIKLIFAFAGSLIISLSIFLLTKENDKKKSKEQTIKSLKSDIFSLCERLIRYAIHTNEHVLNCRYYYAMHKINADNDSEIDKERHIDYAKKASDGALQINILRADLIEKILQLEVYWDDDKKLKKIIELMGNANSLLLKDFVGIFNEEMDKNQILDAYNQNIKTIKNYVIEKSLGKDLREIQFVIHPKYYDRLIQNS